MERKISQSLLVITVALASVYTLWNLFGYISLATTGNPTSFTTASMAFMLATGGYMMTFIFSVVIPLVGGLAVVFLAHSFHKKELYLVSMLVSILVISIYGFTIASRLVISIYGFTVASRMSSEINLNLI